MGLRNLNTGRTCLIGNTGFVGGHLIQQVEFTAWFNTSNISMMGAQEYDVVVCAAAPGSMFEANNSPNVDRIKVQALIDNLSKIKTKRFILISSIAVLQDFAGGDCEDTQKYQKKLAYGRHRRELEAFVEEQFGNNLIVRLPALFGRGLRKNFIFDLLNPVPTMLTHKKMEDLSSVFECKLLDKVRKFYATDEQTGFFKLDRAALNDDHDRTYVEDAFSAHGLLPLA